MKAYINFTKLSSVTLFIKSKPELCQIIKNTSIYEK